MSINDIANDESFLLYFGVFFIIAIVVLLLLMLPIILNSNKIIYGDGENSPINKQNNVKILSRRSIPHPINKSLMINMVVFELNEGTRIELAIKEEEKYSVMIEGDMGTLTYQGKKFIDFERG